MSDEPLTDEQIAYLERRYHPDSARRSLGRFSGWRFGTPQCDACRRILKAYNAQCPNCGGYSRPRDGARAA